MELPVNEESENNNETVPFPNPITPLPIGRNAPCKDDDPNIPPNYRPWILRPITLVILALLPLIVLAITEYLFHCSVQQTGIFDPVGGETRLAFRSFVSQFFSLLVLVLAGLFFQDLDLAVKTMEPFYHLSKAEGANGEETLLVDYFRPLVYFTPFQAASYSHWAVVCSSLAYIISTNVLPTLALGVFGVTEDEAPMDPVYTHCLGAFCVVITLLNLLLWYILGKRRSGLLSFPDNLDAYIELSSGLDPDNSLHELFRPWIQHDDVDEDKLRTTLKQHRFRLMRREADLKSPLDIVLLTAETPPDRKLAPPSPLKKLWKRLGKPFQPLARFWQKLWGIRSSHPILFQTRPLAFLMAVLLGLFIIANGQMFWAKFSSFFTFIGEKRFARSSISTMIHTIIWAPIRKNARLMEPFYRLTRPDGVKKNVLDLKAEWPFQDLIHSARSVRNTKNKQAKDYCMIFIMGGAYASNTFVVAWNTLALDGETAGLGFWISYGLQLTSEVLMAIALVAIFAWRRTPIVPILPVTIASNLFYVYATDLPAGRFQDFQQRINPSTSSLSSEILGEGKENSSVLTKEKVTTNLPNDAGESQTKPPDFAVNELKNDNRGQTEQLSEAVPSPSIDTSACVKDTEASETFSQEPAATTVPTAADQNLAPALEAANGTDSTNSAENKSNLDSTREPNNSGPTMQISPASKTIDSGEKPCAEIESEIMCGFGHFRGRDQQMHLGVGRFSSIESKYIAFTTMNKKKEMAV